ncbi:3-deoxy-7-phosphoheptulonate synthase [Sodalis sp. CWE]|uniref:3-deoxy-7-phosphoheptulonate synthase n=1 Tax=Sodalis sp. CWE TaxID=2803816 RepID=UPI001C7CF957|nr:3-deoxy-7-phosphoheptulonate synthase [Sodalis sp. CWE]MBX4181146.1 3-deoxy-7-phosphoheptulonate synthase [Sodalis sp. CWE]
MTDELCAKQISQLITPNMLISSFPLSAVMKENILKARQRIGNILCGNDPRLLVIIGPCSIHDVDAALDYARRLNLLRIKYQSRLEIVMRTYFEKPRSIAGWRGLIADPGIDNSFRINDGLKIARQLLLAINTLGLPSATEFLDIIIGQYIIDLISWGAIGARTAESQVHRAMASAMPCPIGFKNNTDGNIQIAINAIRAARSSHFFLSQNKKGQITAYRTKGNKHGHIIMRGGAVPNYQKQDITNACIQLASFGLPSHLLVDFSHGNCQKQYLHQLKVAHSLCEQLQSNHRQIVGVMIESNLVEGNQKPFSDLPLIYGQSVTDACLGWDDTEQLIILLNKMVSCRFNR